MSIIGTVLVFQKRHRPLLGVLIIMNFFVFLTIVTFTVHALVATSAQDVCAEVEYQGGMFDLWQQLAVTTFAQLNNITSSFVTTLEAQGCQDFTNFCTLVLNGVTVSLCDYFQCNLNFLLSLGTFTLIDTGGVLINVTQCATSCINSQLRSDTSKFVAFYNLYVDYLDLQASLATLLQGIASEATRAFLQQIICNGLESSLQVVYTGCGILLPGQLLVMLGFFFWGW